MKKNLLISREEINKHPILNIICKKKDVVHSINIKNRPIINLLRILCWQGDYIVTDPIVAILCLWRRYTFYSLEMFEYQVDERNNRNKIRNKIFKLFHYVALKKANKVIFPNEVRMEYYLNKISLDKSKCKVYPNYPSQSVLNEIDDILLRKENSELNLESFFYSLGYDLKNDIENRDVYVYIGTINKGVRGIDKIIDAIRKKQNSFLIFAGPQREKNFKEFEMSDCYIYLGQLEQKKALELLCISNYAILYYSRDLKNTNYCAPVKLFEYINANVNIISNKCVGLSEYYNVIYSFFSDDGHIIKNEDYDSNANKSFIGKSYEKNFELDV